MLETEVFNYTLNPHGGAVRDRVLTFLAQVLPSLAVRNAREVILAVATPAWPASPHHPLDCLLAPNHSAPAAVSASASRHVSPRLRVREPIVETA